MFCWSSDNFGSAKVSSLSVLAPRINMFYVRLQTKWLKHTIYKRITSYSLVMICFLEEQLLVRVRFGWIVRKEAALIGPGCGRLLLLAVEIEMPLLGRLWRLRVVRQRVVRGLLGVAQLVQPVQGLVDGPQPFLQRGCSQNVHLFREEILISSWQPIRIHFHPPLAAGTRAAGRWSTRPRPGRRWLAPSRAPPAASGRSSAGSRASAPCWGSRTSRWPWPEPHPASRPGSSPAPRQSARRRCTPPWPFRSRPFRCAPGSWSACSQWCSGWSSRRPAEHSPGYPGWCPHHSSATCRCVAAQCQRSCRRTPLPFEPSTGNGARRQTKDMALPERRPCRWTPERRAPGRSPVGIGPRSGLEWIVSLRLLGTSSLAAWPARKELARMSPDAGGSDSDSDSDSEFDSDWHWHWHWIPQVVTCTMDTRSCNPCNDPSIPGSTCVRRAWPLASIVSCSTGRSQSHWHRSAAQRPHSPPVLPQIHPVLKW